VPVLSGPRLHNFEHVARLLDQAGALTRVHTAEELGGAITALLGDEAGRQRQGEAGAAVVAAHRGALQRVVSSVAAFWPTE
jgi:3-deoxy-D-manno-octulosonic-acid transferase